MLLVQCGFLVYYIFMILYLTKASKCDEYLEKKDNQFRQAALIISYILAILTGLNIVGVLAVLLK